MVEAFEAGGDAMVYTRYNNPTIAACEEKLAAVEGAESALAFSSGMAAITSVLFDLLRPGDRLLCQREVYGGTHEFVSHWASRVGWTADWFSVGDRASLETGAAQLFSLVERGRIEIEVNQRFALRDAAEAHRDLEARRTTGCTVLNP